MVRQNVSRDDFWWGKVPERERERAFSETRIGGLNKCDWSGLCPFPLRNMTGRGQTGGGERIIGEGLLADGQRGDGKTPREGEWLSLPSISQHFLDHFEQEILFKKSLKTSEMSVAPSIPFYELYVFPSPEFTPLGVVLPHLPGEIFRPFFVNFSHFSLILLEVQSVFTRFQSLLVKFSQV